MTKNFYIIYGPSGAGKTKILDRIHNTIYEAIKTKKRFEQNKLRLLNSIFYTTISSTTREARVNEMHLIDYKFYTKEEFKERDFIEFAEFNNNFYGTETEEVQHETEITAMVLEIDGIIQVSKKIQNLRVIFMNIDEEVIIENLIKDGYTQSEALKRYNRGNILEDRQKLIEEGIEDTLEINNLDTSMEKLLDLMKKDSDTLNSLLS